MDENNNDLIVIRDVESFCIAETKLRDLNQNEKNALLLGAFIVKSVQTADKNSYHVFEWHATEKNKLSLGLASKSFSPNKKNTQNLKNYDVKPSIRLIKQVSVSFDMEEKNNLGSNDISKKNLSHQFSQKYDDSDNFEFFSKLNSDKLTSPGSSTGKQRQNFASLRPEESSPFNETHLKEENLNKISYILPSKKNVPINHKRNSSLDSCLSRFDSIANETFFDFYNIYLQQSSTNSRNTTKPPPPHSMETDTGKDSKFGEVGGDSKNSDHDSKEEENSFKSVEKTSVQYVFHKDSEKRDFEKDGERNNNIEKNTNKKDFDNYENDNCETENVKDGNTEYIKNSQNCVEMSSCISDISNLVNDLKTLGFRQSFDTNVVEFSDSETFCDFDVFIPIYREYSYHISSLKLIYLKKKDSGYLMLYDFNYSYKTFRFYRGFDILAKFIMKKMKWLVKSKTIPHKNDNGHLKKIGFINILQRGKTDFIDPLIQNKNLKENSLNYNTFCGLFNNLGQLVDIHNFKRYGYICGFEEELRPLAWKFILNYYPYASTYSERNIIDKKFTEKYNKLSSDRLSIWNLFDKDKTYSSIIEKDVVRTDRRNPYFAGDDNPNLDKMRNILLNYAYYRPSIGYSQGMSDLLAPILCNMKDEATSFWCFKGFMETLYSASIPSDERMDHMMFILYKLMEIFCKDVYNHLKKNDIELSMIFLHRWLILSFQREFNSKDNLKIWEACWCCPLLENGYFQLFIALAMIMLYQSKTKCGMSIFYHTPDEILGFFSNIIKISNANDVLVEARRLLHQFRMLKSIKCDIRCLMYRQPGFCYDVMPKMKCYCPVKENCVYENWNIKTKMSKLIELSKHKICYQQEN